MAKAKTTPASQVLLVMPSNELADIIKLVAPYAIPDKAMAHYINNVLFDLRKKESCFVGTNGHYLSVYRKESARDFEVSVSLSAHWLLKTLLPILPVYLLDIKEVTVSSQAGAIVFEWEGVRLSVVPSDIKFPAWEQVIPKGATTRIASMSTRYLQQLLAGKLIEDKGQNPIATLSADNELGPLVLTYPHRPGLTRILMPIRMD